MGLQRVGQEWATFTLTFPLRRHVDKNVRIFAFTFLLILDCCKNNCDFALLHFAIWYWNTSLNKYYVIYCFSAHFSIYLFLLMTYYLLFILYSLYTIETMLDKKANSSDVFLFEFKWAVKHWRQLTTSTTHLAEELLTNIQCSGDSRNFAKERRDLKIRSTVAGVQKLTMTNGKQWSKLITLHEELQKNWTLAILPSFGIWSKLERWKSSISGCLMSWQKILILKCHLLLFYTTTMNHFLIGLWHMMTSGFYMTTSSVHLSGQIEQKLQNTSQSQTFTKKKKKIMVTVPWIAASLIHSSFLNPRKTIISEKYAQQIDEMHQKLQCLQPALVNRMVPILHYNDWPHITQLTLQKLNELGYEVLPHPPYSPDLSPTQYPFFKHLDNFLQRKHFHKQQEAENPFQELFKSWSSEFYATGINKHLSLEKMCWL